MSLLFHESPVIGVTSLIAIAASVYCKSNIAVAITVVIFLFLIYFYRYQPCCLDVQNNVLYSPCEGTVLNVTERYGYYYAAIFLSPFNKHTQIYPANGIVIKRQYDHSPEITRHGCTQSGCHR